MARTHRKGSGALKGKRPSYTAESAATGVEAALEMLDGKWKLAILFHLFVGKLQRFSDLERTMPEVSQKMLAQQLRALERDGLVTRRVHPEIPPRVEYGLTEWGASLCPRLDGLLVWMEERGKLDGERR